MFDSRRRDLYDYTHCIRILTTFVLSLSVHRMGTNSSFLVVLGRDIDVLCLNIITIIISPLLSTVAQVTVPSTIHLPCSSFVIIVISL